MSSIHLLNLNCGEWGESQLPSSFAPTFGPKVQDQPQRALVFRVSNSRPREEVGGGGALWVCCWLLLPCLPQPGEILNEKLGARTGVYPHCSRGDMKRGRMVMVPKKRARGTERPGGAGPWGRTTGPRESLISSRSQIQRYSVQKELQAGVLRRRTAGFHSLPAVSSGLFSKRRGD